MTEVRGQVGGMGNVLECHLQKLLLVVADDLADGWIDLQPFSFQ
ncbi:MAG TPA: hypothetical protein VMZ30_21035 [Pyrinomonadaceae bacterium]|nr:hypothetical protein [Pyrinomonadaceae bacterium]